MTDKPDKPTRVGADRVDLQRVARAVSGEGQFSDLTPEEKAIANARIDEGIRARATATDYAAQARTDGVTAVTLDAAGRMIETTPDGVVTVLDQHGRSIERASAQLPVGWLSEALSHQVAVSRWITEQAPDDLWSVAERAIGPLTMALIEYFSVRNLSIPCCR